MIKAAIFDMDGTITDTEKCNVEYWIKASRDFGFDVSEHLPFKHLRKGF